MKNKLEDFGFKLEDNIYKADYLKNHYEKINNNYYDKFYIAYFKVLNEPDGCLEVGLYLNSFDNQCLVLSTTCTIGCCGRTLYEGDFSITEIVKLIKEKLLYEFDNFTLDINNKSLWDLYNE